jgi:hypothetical protein
MELVKIKHDFAAVCKQAQNIQLINNFEAAFEAVVTVNQLRNILTDDVMKAVFMPLMNTKIGFLTDRSGKPSKNGQTYPVYSIAVVRDALIDAISFGLQPTGNQFNIIAERMYPTKEGYTMKLKQLGVKYITEIGIDKSTNANFAEIPCKISYEFQGEKNSFTILATVKKDSYSSHDQLRGKAERKAKKQLFEYITGCDLGDADEESSTVNGIAIDITEAEKNKTKLLFDEPKK